MSHSYLIRNARVVNEGFISENDVLIHRGRIEKIAPSVSVKYAVNELDATGKYLMPGMIDDQVHFREPGLTHKADIHSEARAAVAGGVTSFMEMPNTNPQATTQALLADKYAIASRSSLANYSFFMGATNDNLEELKKTDPETVCGIKIFMGSSTGNMLVDNDSALEKIYSECSNLIAIHSESESIIRQNLERYKAEYGDNIPMEAHPLIRSVEACVASTDKAVKLAKKWNTRLHILHISTAEELDFFRNDIPLKDKLITSEVCVHHLWFDAGDYERLGGLIKCNPAIKEARHKAALFEALLDDRLDIIATDHAPHTRAEKQGNYMNCPSGLPLVQHPVLMMLEYYHQGKISLEKIAEKTAHAPATCFRLRDRGFIREGYHADLLIANTNETTLVDKANLFYKCGWSPLEGYRFRSNIESVFVSGHLAWHHGKFDESQQGQRLLFEKR